MNPDEDLIVFRDGSLDLRESLHRGRTIAVVDHRSHRRTLFLGSQRHYSAGAIARPA
jgi:hypothetical protein